jgi:hypothetical protein
MNVFRLILWLYQILTSQHGITIPTNVSQLRVKEYLVRAFSTLLKLNNVTQAPTKEHHHTHLISSLNTRPDQRPHLLWLLLKRIDVVKASSTNGFNPASWLPESEGNLNLRQPKTPNPAD